MIPLTVVDFVLDNLYRSAGKGSDLKFLILRER